MTELRRIEQLEKVISDSTRGDNLRLSSDNIEYLLKNILLELKKMNLHLSKVTDELIDDSDANDI